ncbi:hypothetical protein [Gloeothece citriformis]|nr:hypothetical protein [Gloeothece citriformis]
MRKHPRRCAERSLRNSTPQTTAQIIEPEQQLRHIGYFLSQLRNVN